jgi:hypothetical protein
MTTLQPPETAPKDGSLILADFGWPWLVPTAWNKLNLEWATASFQSDSIGDTWFETEWERESDMTGWMPIPNPPRPPAKSP